MRYLIVLFLILSNLCYGDVGKVDEPFSETLYKQRPRDTFLYICEKTADCLEVQAGWADFDKIRGDGVYCCMLYGSEKGGVDREINNYEELLTLFSRCRSHKLDLLEKK
jgi:hypothetical protein